jgi:cysteine-rich repeat protein
MRFNASLGLAGLLVSVWMVGCGDDEGPVGGDADVGTDAGEAAYCGNGVVEGFEECDDGNDDPFDGCHECRFWEPPSGDPIEVSEPLTWEWFEIEGSRCRDGSPAGISVNMSPGASGVVIYLEGGGACFEAITCAANPTHIKEDASGLAEARRFPGGGGIFNRSDERNPVADWHMVYVPYCTGDVFAGTAEDVDVPNVGVQQFVGYTNVGLFLERLVPTFADVDQVLLTGVSAGGFGAAANAKRVQRDFQDVPVVLLDDSGPPMTNEFILPCLQEQWRTLWGFDDSILADCGAECRADDYVIDMTAHLLRHAPDRVGGLFSHRQDTIIRFFYGFSHNDCQGTIPLTEATFEAGLADFRGFIEDRADNFGTFYIDGLSHTCITNQSCFYETEAEDVALTDWVADLLDGTTSHVGP